MKAIITKQPLPANDPGALIDIELPRPTPAGRDLLVGVRAISINPVDTKVRASVTSETGRILGWDASGVVEAVGSDVQGFQVGDEVFYAGDITRPGSNAEYQLVDERIVGSKPKSLSFADAAAFPLVTITAWESLFERLDIKHDCVSGRSILIIGGAGGVGSMAIQLARQAGLTVIATASRADSQQWILDLGAHHAVNHRGSIPEQLTALGFPEVDYIANFVDTDAYWDIMAHVIKPMGKIVSVVETSSAVDLGLLKSKSATFAWEFMFTRSQLQTPDMAEQGRLLTDVAQMIDEGKIRSITGERLSGISAEHLRIAHGKAESGRLIGKLILDGWAE